MSLIGIKEVNDEPPSITSNHNKPLITSTTSSTSMTSLTTSSTMPTTKISFLDKIRGSESSLLTSTMASLDRNANVNIGARSPTPQPSQEFIKRNLKCCSFTWIIEDFRRRRERLGEAIISPTFIAEDENSNESTLGPTFKVFFYPNGIEEPDQTACYLWIEDSKEPDTIKARFSVSLLDKSGDAKVLKVCPFLVRGVRQRVGWQKFFPRRKIMDTLQQIIVNGRVTLVIDVFFIEDDIPPEQGNAIFNLASIFCPRTRCGSEEFRRLFEEKQFDICIKTRDGKNVPAHRAVLSSTAIVIEKHLIRDRRTFYIIDDFDSKIIMDSVYFMYFRTFESDDPDFVGLLQFAETYKIPALKFACEQELYESASFDNVLDLYQVANECHSELLENALKFVIIENCAGITETSGWKKLLQSDHKMITHLFNVMADEVCRRMSTL